MYDLDSQLITEAYLKICEEGITDTLSEIVQNQNSTYKFKIVKDRDAGEWQIRILKQQGTRFVDLGDDRIVPCMDKYDAITTLSTMVDEFKNRSDIKLEHEDAKPHTHEASKPNTKCKKCGERFNYGDQSETSMGSVACPSCNETCPQEDCHCDG